MTHDLHGYLEQGIRQEIAGILGPHPGGDVPANAGERERKIAPDGGIGLDLASCFVTVPEIDPNPSYEKAPFIVKLHEMGFDNAHSAASSGSPTPTTRCTSRRRSP